MRDLDEQVKTIRGAISLYRQNLPGYIKGVLQEAAGTIESLSTELADGERSAQHEEDAVFEKIIMDLDKLVGLQLQIIADLNADEMRKYGYAKSLEAYQQAKLMVEISFAEYKEKRAAEDGDGWIYCGDGKNLP